jgi:peptide/nickel transport system ATP-binding protein
VTDGTEPVPVLRAERLTKHYPVRDAAKRVSATTRRRFVHAVDDISFDLRSGAAIALVGESGSGKSTTGQLVAHLESPTSGRLLLRGAEPDFKSRSVLKRYRRQVQMIFQDPYSSLNPVHTVAYHLERPLHIHDRAESRRDARAKALELLERVHLTPAVQVIDKLPHELSGGQRQRVAIARALAVQPNVLVADEPVSMLDVSVRLSILNLLAELVAENDLALLYITHDIASARYFAEQILVMYAGQVVEAGAAEQITQSPAHPYTKLLISAAPDPDAAQGARRKLQSPGEPPSLIDPPAGCRFHPRCPYAMPVCAEQQPPAFSTGNGQWAACWLLSNDQAASPKPPATRQASPPAASRQEQAKEQKDA